MPSILFVCTANRARSPFAAACFRRELAERGLEREWQVASAGTWASDGLPPLPEALLAAQQMHLDLAGHRSAAITAAALAAADLVVVMELGHKQALEIEFPESASKLHLLSEVATGIAYNLPDPAIPTTGKGIYAEVAQLVHDGFDRIRALASM